MLHSMPLEAEAFLQTLNTKDAFLDHIQFFFYFKHVQKQNFENNPHHKRTACESS